MTAACPRLIIAGTASGIGKTSITLGLARALTRAGLRVQPFKTGPDFLDPTYLALAAGRTCYNLDGWMMGRDYVTGLLEQKTADGALALIEGVMGLFDSARWDALSGSTAELAVWLDAPVLLIVDAHGAARSIAATVKGFAEFEPAVRIAGVIANRVGSAAHAAGIAQSLAAANLPPLLGGIPQGALPELKSRHLGLHSADRATVPDSILNALADACEQHLDLHSIRTLAALNAPQLSAAASAKADAFHVSAVASAKADAPRIGIVRDAAFHFYYPDNLDALTDAGAELVFFSPLADPALPGNIHALYLGGGYPEEHAAQLSANRTMLDSIRAFAQSGRPVYAECGGLMLLCSELITTDARRHPMAGVIPAAARMLPRLKTLGYVEATLTADSLWGRARAVCRGHEFHYSELVDPPPPDWQRVYALTNAAGASRPPEGFQKGRVLAGYIHLHFASRPGLARHLVEQCKETP